MPKPVYSILTGGGTTSITQQNGGRSRRGQPGPEVNIDKIIHLGGYPLKLSERGLVELCQELKLELTNIQYAVHTSGPLEGRSRGFSWLEFKDGPTAQKAIKVLNGLRFDKESTFTAQPYVPSQQTNQTNHGFATLKQRNADGSSSMAETSSTTTATTIDGVPIKQFLKAIVILDDLIDDDMVPIFGLDPVQPTHAQ